MHETVLDILKIRAQFPILDQQVNNRPLIYLDNAATSQKPITVINALNDYYTTDNANIHRGVHTLAERATNAFEATRKKAQQFINATSPEEIIFTKGTTESINLVAASFGRKFIKENDEIIISAMEHHSNIVPWQLLCEEKGCKLRIIPITQSGEILFDEYLKLLNKNTKLVAITHISNALGTINSVNTIISSAHEIGAKVLIDGAQAAPHLPIDVQALDADFYALSAHKVYGPTGIGLLYGKRELLDAMPPYQSGGEMIKEVSFSGTTYNDIPYKFEAGTPSIGAIIAFKAALDFVDNIGKEHIIQYEQSLLTYAIEKLSDIDTFRPIGTAQDKASVISFLLEGIHPFDVGQLLDAKGIAVRTGHHCTQPLMDFFNIEGTVRASFAIYNTKEEIDMLAKGLKSIVKTFAS